MQAGTAYLELHNQVAATICRHICAEYELKVPASKWITHLNVLERRRQWIDVEIPSESNVKKKESMYIYIYKYIYLRNKVTSAAQTKRAQSEFPPTYFLNGAPGFASHHL